MDVQDSSTIVSTPLRVVGVDPERGFGGGETQVLGLTLALLSAGHRAELMCDPAGALAQRAREAGIRCHPLRIRNSVDVAAGLRLRAFLARERLDVVHFHTARAHALAPYVRGRARALVVTRRMDYVPNRLFAPWLYNHAVDGVAAISRPVADSLTRAGVARGRIAIIASGVDCGRFTPPSAAMRASARASLGLGAHEIAVGMVAALERRKGHRYLLEALASARGATVIGAADGGAVPLRCFLAGEGSLHDALVADLHRLGLQTTVRMLGRLEDPRTLLWALDLFVMPSLHEGLGVAALEAMACGLPAILSNSGGLGEIAEDGRTAVKVPPADAAALSEAIVRLAHDPQARATMGAAGRAMVTERFGMEAMARRTLELYHACIAKETKRSGRVD